MDEVVYIRARVLYRERPAPVPGTDRQWPPVPSVYCEAIGQDAKPLGMEFYAPEAAAITIEEMRKKALDMATEMVRKGGYTKR